MQFVRPGVPRTVGRAHGESRASGTYPHPKHRRTRVLASHPAGPHLVVGSLVSAEDWTVKAAFSVTGDKFEIVGRGTVYMATLDDYPAVTRADLDTILGRRFQTPEGEFEVRGVESTMGLDLGRTIGLLVRRVNSSEE